MSTPADSPFTGDQLALGAHDGDGTAISASGLQTIYGGSETCPGCGGIMNPIQVLYGYGLCPTCQSHKNASRMKDRMV